MKKGVLTMLVLGAAALMASCGNDKFIPREIDGVEFTGDGIFGDIPYIAAVHNIEGFELDKEMKQSGMSAEEKKKKDMAFSEEYHAAFEDAIKRIDGKEVSFERHVGGKTEEIKGVKLEVDTVRITHHVVYDDNLRTYTAGVHVNLLLPESYKVGRESIGGYTHFNQIIALDKDGNPVSEYNKVNWRREGCYFKNSAFNLDRANNKAEMIAELSIYDRTVKLVEVDEAAFDEYMKKRDEAAAKDLEEKAEGNRGKEFTFAEDGFASITLGAKFKDIPKSFEGLFTHLKMETDTDKGLRKYSFYNGEELVFMAQGFSDVRTINQIVIFTKNIGVKTENGKTVKIGMKLADVVKDFKDNCNVSWTGEEPSPVIHAGSSIKFDTVDATFTPSFLKRVKGIEGSFEDMLPVTAADISSDEKVESIVLGY